MAEVFSFPGPSRSPSFEAMAQTEWVTCPNQCGARLYYREVQVHVQTVCTERREHCSMGCGELVKFRERQKHKMLFCACRIVACKYAPQCKWAGMFKDLAIHTDNFLTYEEKQKLVPGDPSIECLERPWLCWHPPLLAPAQDLTDGFGYRIRWPGCGKEIRFGDRTRHESKECHFRMVHCPNGCGQEVVGYRLQEHLEGKNPLDCISTTAWVKSGCLLRDVYCKYVLGQKREGADRVVLKKQGKGTGKAGSKKSDKKQTRLKNTAVNTESAEAAKRTETDNSLDDGAGQGSNGADTWSPSKGGEGNAQSNTRKVMHVYACEA